MFEKHCPNSEIARQIKTMICASCSERLNRGVLNFESVSSASLQKKKKNAQGERRNAGSLRAVMRKCSQLTLVRNVNSFVHGVMEFSSSSLDERCSTPLEYERTQFFGFFLCIFCLRPQKISFLRENTHTHVHTTVYREPS